jgi:hypothetical protein
MYECLICKETKDVKNKVELSCSHDLCKSCLKEWQKRASTCPFCRANFVVEDPDPEEWMFLDPSEWIVYSKTDMKKGEERIYVFKKDERQPSWRNDDITIKLRRSKRVRKIFRNRQTD